MCKFMTTWTLHHQIFVKLTHVVTVSEEHLFNTEHILNAQCFDKIVLKRWSEDNI